MNVTVTIGWTKHAAHPDYPHRYNCEDYVPFRDTYRPGQPQHTITFDLDLPDVLDHPVEITAEQVAEACFHALNAPEVAPGSLAAEVLAAVQATGYTGREAHYSLSVGDTVTVSEVMLGCARFGWERITPEVAL